MLKEAVKNGGTTIKDFRQPSGKLGYFQQKLNVYGRDGLNCFNCNTKVILIRISNRQHTYALNVKIRIYYEI